MSLWLTLQTLTMAATYGLRWCANSSLLCGWGKEDAWCVWPCKSGSFLRLQFVPHHPSTLCSTPDHASLLLFPERHTLSYAEHTLLFCDLLGFSLYPSSEVTISNMLPWPQLPSLEESSTSEPIITSLFRMPLYEFGMKNMPARQTGLLLTLWYLRVSQTIHGEGPDLWIPKPLGINMLKCD